MSKEKMLYRIWMTFLAVIVIMTVYFMVQSVTDKLSDQKQETDKYIAQARANAKKFDEANSRVATLENQVKALGKTPAAAPVVPSTSSNAPSFSQLLQGISTFCMPRNDCIGPRGPVAKDGKDGISPPPAKDGATGSKGDTGDKGDKGDKGDPAPKVTNVTCNGTTGVFTFSDSSTYSVDNMCAAPLIAP
jgi:hypothetical protein